MLGLSGWVQRIMARLPMAIIMGMVAAVFIRFGLGLVTALRDDIWIALPMTAVFVLLTLSPSLSRRLPPLIAVLVVGVIAVALQGSFKPVEAISFTIVSPVFTRPEFSVQALAELVLPLAITVLAAQNAQGIGILASAGHRPPVNTITVTCGVAASFTAGMGSVGTCLTGPVNAIICAAGGRETQYSGAVFVGLLAILYGLAAPMITRLLLATPPAFIATLAGLALLRVLQSAFVASFQGRFTLGALVTFLVTLSEVAIFNIGAPFWGLVFGFTTSWLLERDDFKAEEA